MLFVGTGKRREQQAPMDVQEGNKTWWSTHPMAYDWRGEIQAPRHSQAWFDAIDQRFIHHSRLFATDHTPFDRIIPYEKLKGARVLEVGCGMGLHTELMARAGARVTAVDLTPNAVESTNERLRLKGLNARIIQADAENLPFESGSFDFVWSWGVIHHSARTGRIIREIARVLTPEGETRVMVYNRESMFGLITLLKDHLLSGGFLRHSFDESLYRRSDGFSARFFIQEHFEDTFRAFFEDVSSEVMGQESDAVPLPRKLRALAMKIVPEELMRRTQARYGMFIFLRAARPI